MMELIPISQMTTEELVFRITDGLRRRKFDGWELKFAMSIALHGKRSAWVPSPKQKTVMRRLIDEMRTPDTGALIDEADHG